MPSLLTKLDETQEEIVQVRDEMLEALHTFYSSSCTMLSMDEAVKMAVTWSTDASDGFPGERDVTEHSVIPTKVRQLNAALLSAVDRLQLDENSDMAPEAHLLVSWMRRERLEKQAQESKTMLALVEQLLEIDQRLGDVDVAIDHEQFAVAAGGMVEVERMVQEWVETNSSEDSESGDCKLVRAVKQQVLGQKERLLDRLANFFSRMAVWHDRALRVTTEFSGKGMTRRTVEERRRDYWEACEVLDILAPRLQDIAKDVSRHLIKPMLQTSRGRTRRGQDESGATLEVVALDVNVDDALVESGIVDVQGKCASVVMVLHFLHEELFAGTVGMIHRFEDFVWKIPGNLEAQLMNMLQDEIPHDATALDAYRKVLADTVVSLEDNLTAIGFSACNNSQLRGFVDELNQLHATKRRQVILSSGRTLISQAYHDSVMITEDFEKESFSASIQCGKNDKSGVENDATVSPMALESRCFQVPECRVSVCAHEVVELVHRTLHEACTSADASACAKVFYQTARDLFFLFRTIVPTLYGDDIANDPRTCMLYHNDCLYVSYHMLIVECRYKHRLPAPLDRTATMVDMLSSFQEDGEQALIAYTSSQMNEVMSGVKHLPSLGTLESEFDVERVTHFLKNALDKLKEMSCLWREGLPVRIYVKTMSRMLEPLVQHFVDDVLTQTTISDKTGAHVYRLLSLLLESEALFTSPAQAVKFAPSLNRLSELAAILMDPLATVRDKLDSGFLDAFSPKELASLVRSLFRESPEKREFLQKLLALESK
uniref:Centromere/kinetochore protein zw10 n=1 Tax=Peronospora matthiolae TaxID=2874970 RepID=A0AAV1V2E7_9STRA